MIHVAVNENAATAMINTQIASAAASMTWILYEKRRDGKATTLGVALLTTKAASF